MNSKRALALLLLLLLVGCYRPDDYVTDVSPAIDVRKGPLYERIATGQAHTVYRLVDDEHGHVCYTVLYKGAAIWCSNLKAGQ